MKKRFKFKSIKVLAISTVFALLLSLIMPAFFNNSSQAVGGIDVVWDGVADGAPIFVVNNKTKNQTCSNYF